MSKKKNDDLVKVVALKSFPGHKKGDTWMAPQRKLRKRTREVRLGLIKAAPAKSK